MDVSNHDSMKDLVEGPDEVKAAVELTGLPEDWVYEEIQTMLDATGGHSSAPQSLDELRAIMLEYLEHLIEEEESASAQLMQ